MASETAHEIYHLYYKRWNYYNHDARRRVTSDLEAEPVKLRNQFKRAAISCRKVEATPRDFVLAQFAKFREFAAHGSLAISLPQPCHMYGLGAEARYIEYKIITAELRKRSYLNEEKQVQQVFFREERKLRGLARMMRVPVSDVLTTRPEEFSPAFLEHYGVWEIVEEIYYENQEKDQ